MNATLRPADAIGVAVVLAAAVFAVVTAAATNSARAAPGATDRAEAAPKVLIFGQGTWNGSGRRHETFTDGPYPLDVDTRISFTLKIAANARASGSFRQEGTSTPNGNGWGGQMKHVITGTLAGDAGNVAIVGQISTAGKITYKGKGVPLASTKAYSARLGPTSAGCNVVNSKYWSARRVAGTGKTPAPATIKTSEKNALQALDAALDMRPYNPPLDILRSVTGWLYTLNLQIEAARTCGVAPAGYKRGLPGRVDVVTVLRDLIKSLASQGKPYSAFGYQPNDVVNLVNSAVDAGLMGDPTARQVLESWLDQALTDRFGKAGAEGVVDDIERAARRAGMSSLADRAAKG